MFCFGAAYKFWAGVYGLSGISWVMVGPVRDEIWAWKGVKGRRKHLDVILLTIFGLCGMTGIGELLRG